MDLGGNAFNAELAERRARQYQAGIENARIDAGVQASNSKRTCQR
jgi:hypothetical protein